MTGSNSLFDNETWSVDTGNLKAKLFIATDLETTVYITLAIFVGMTLALAIYAKLLK